MYVVILAGGGGTRLWPLSRPDRPKPFLPLLDDTSLLQRTVARLGSDLGADVTVVTDRRYERLVREQLPDAAIVLEPAGRNTAAAIALATVAVDRPDDDVMVVLPADHVVDREREGVFHDVLVTAATELATGDQFGIVDPLVTLGVQVAHPSTEYGYLLPRPAARERVGGIDAYPLRAFEEKPPPARAEELARDAGVAWNAGMFLWRRRAIRSALERYTGLIQLLQPVRHSSSLLEHAYEQLRPVSIDHAVMESAARDGHVVMASMDVGWSDIGSWTALLAAIDAGGAGRVVRPGETVTVDAGDLVVRRTATGDARVVRPLEAGSMTATQPIAVLHGADAARVEALLERCARWEEAR